jgi:hypothetical protein
MVVLTSLWRSSSCTVRTTVELDEAADGAQVGFLGPEAQMREPHDLAAILQEVLNRHSAACGQDRG